MGAAAALAVAYSDDTGRSEGELVGTWNATEFEFVSAANPNRKLDAIAFGATVKMVLRAGGRTRSPPGSRGP